MDVAVTQLVTSYFAACRMERVEETILLTTNSVTTQISAKFPVIIISSAYLKIW